jgi:hypothetical protein
MSKQITIEDLDLNPEEQATFLMGSLIMAGRPEEEVVDGVANEVVDNAGQEEKLEYGD